MRNVVPFDTAAAFEEWLEAWLLERLGPRNIFNKQLCRDFSSDLLAETVTWLSDHAENEHSSTTLGRALTAEAADEL